MDLCNKRGYKVKFLLENEEKLKEDANKIGYQHLLGSSKKQLHKQCLKLIYKIDKNVYQTMKQQWSSLFPDSFDY